MTDRPGPNQGIQIGAGNLNATNVAVGAGASITITEAAAREARDVLAALRADLAALQDAQARREAGDATAEIEAEIARPEPRPDRLQTALSRLEAICAAGTTAATFAAKLQPQLRALAGLVGF